MSYATPNELRERFGASRVSKSFTEAPLDEDAAIQLHLGAASSIIDLSLGQQVETPVNPANVAETFFSFVKSAELVFAWVSMNGTKKDVTSGLKRTHDQYTMMLKKIMDGTVRIGEAEAKPQATPRLQVVGSTPHPLPDELFHAFRVIGTLERF